VAGETPAPLLRVRALLLLLMLFSNTTAVAADSTSVPTHDCPVTNSKPRGACRQRSNARTSRSTPAASAARPIQPWFCVRRSQASSFAFGGRPRLA